VYVHELNDVFALARDESWLRALEPERLQHPGKEAKHFLRIA